MPKYRLTEKTKSLTGAHGRPLLPGQEYADTDFMHLKEHIANGHIEDAEVVRKRDEAREIAKQEEAKKEIILTEEKSTIAGTGEAIQMNADAEPVKKK